MIEEKDRHPVTSLMADAKSRRPVFAIRDFIYSRINPDTDAGRKAYMGLLNGTLRAMSNVPDEVYLATWEI